MFRSTEIDGFFCPNKICSKRKIDSRTNILCVLRQCDGHSRGDDIAVEDRSMKFEPEDHRKNMSKIESIKLKSVPYSAAVLVNICPVCTCCNSSSNSVERARGTKGLSLVSILTCSNLEYCLELSHQERSRRAKRGEELFGASTMISRVYFIPRWRCQC